VEDLVERAGITDGRRPGDAGRIRHPRKHADRSRLDQRDVEADRSERDERRQADPAAHSRGSGLASYTTRPATTVISTFRWRMCSGVSSGPSKTVKSAT